MKKSIRELCEENKHLEINDRNKAIFVGDTHGDLEASKSVWNSYKDLVKEGNAYIVFLGDYVDRGKDSKGNIDFLLEKKREFPDGVILLLGNHETYPLQRFKPADFWENLSKEEYDYYKDLVHLPLMVSGNGLVATHGCLPFTKGVEELKLDEGNNVGMPTWRSIVWGDLNEKIEGIRRTTFTGRAKFSKKLVCDYIREMGWKVFIRAHQPSMQGWFSDTVLTIFTSQVYVDLGKAKERNIAIANLKEDISGKDDIKIKRIDEL